MIEKEITADFKKECEKVSERLGKELGRVRTGRASLTILDGVKVDYYGMPTPLNQVAALAVADPRLLTVSPWDASMLGEVEKAIQTAGLGLNPSNDGKIIRIPIPPLTGERRKELARQVKKIGEDYKVSVRNQRRDANALLKEAKDSKEISEDEYHRALKQIQEETDKYVKKLDETLEAKEQEIMEF